MRTGSGTIAAAIATAMLVGGGTASAAPTFTSHIAGLSATRRAAMTPSVWRPGCPVGLGQLRLVTVLRYDFRGRVRPGRLVVHKDVAQDVVAIFRRLYVAKFPIRWMAPIERFGGSDYRSIEADNTSGFNCRYVDGTTRWSNHAYGKAIDINPIENPYVTTAQMTSHPRSRPYISRSPRRGMALPSGSLVRSFTRQGWDWGGWWSGAKDYQHFSKTGG